jgi:hypothetical protein
LSLVTDAYSKKIIMGYDLSDSLAVESSLKALKKALRARKYKDRTLSIISTGDYSIAATNIRLF